MTSNLRLESKSILPPAREQLRVISSLYGHDRDITRGLKGIRTAVEELEIERKAFEETFEVHHDTPCSTFIPSESVNALRLRLKRRCTTDGQLFSVADGNRDNKLSFEEFENGVAAMGIRPMPSEGELRTVFNEMDQDSDGKIQWGELKASGGVKRHDDCGGRDDCVQLEYYGRHPRFQPGHHSSFFRHFDHSDTSELIEM